MNATRENTNFARGKKVLVSGASIAGLSTAYWMSKLDYQVTVVERASEPRVGGAAVNIGGAALDIARRMELFEQLKSNTLTAERWEFKNANDVTVGSILLKGNSNPIASDDDDIEIERDKLIRILLDSLKGKVEFLFNNRITELSETEDEIQVTFHSGSQRAFDLVFGCDGSHSGVRKLGFGDEARYARFLQHYFYLTIVNKSLIPPNTAQMYNVPGKVIMLNAYNNKTDIGFCFFSANEIPYDYRDPEQQRQIVLDHFAGQAWRTDELLEEVAQAETSYFDKFCQITMPSWTKGRVALVGDAAYCASPAAGMGGSLAMIGAATIADALEKHNGIFPAAFHDYNQNLRPFIKEVQATARVVLNEYLIPATEQAIQKRNARKIPF